MYTIPPSIFWSSPLSTFLMIIVKCLTCFSFPVRSINMTNPIQLSYSDKWKYIYKSPNSYINSLLNHVLQVSFTLTPPNILLETFLSKVASSLAIFLLHIQFSAPYVATGLIHVLYIYRKYIGYVIFAFLPSYQVFYVVWWFSRADTCNSLITVDFYVINMVVFNGSFSCWLTKICLPRNIQ